MHAVPNVVGMYYYDAQQALLGAACLISQPTWVLATGLSNTVDNPSLTADSGLTVDAIALPNINPGFVVAQSIVAGTLVNDQTPVGITVVGFTVVNQPGISVAVP